MNLGSAMSRDLSGCGGLRKSPLTSTKPVDERIRNLTGRGTSFLLNSIAQGEGLHRAAPLVIANNSI